MHQINLVSSQAVLVKIVTEILFGSHLLHQHCRVTSLRIIQFPCISWIGIGENYALRSFTFDLHLLPTPESPESFSHTEVRYADATGGADFFGGKIF